MSGPVPARFRIGQRDFGASPWLVCPFLPDAELASQGWKLAGPGRDASALSFGEREELGWLLDMAIKQQSPEDHARETELLERCPYTTYVPPIDIDVAEESAAFKKIGGPQEAYGAALRYAQILHQTCQEVGLGEPDWHRTNARGGTHGDLLAPEEIADAQLLLYVRALVQRAARIANVPLLSQQPHRKEERRHAVYVDDTLFSRTTAKRGVQWRLVGASKPGKDPKQPWNVFVDQPRPSSDRRVTISIQALAAERERAMELLHEEEEPEASRPTPAERVERNRALFATTRAPLSQADMAWLAAHPEIKAQFDTPVASIADRSAHLWHVVLAAKKAGADDQLMARLGWNMPGSKAAEREDSFLLNQIQKLHEQKNYMPVKRTNRVIVDRGHVEIIPEMFDWAVYHLAEAKEPQKLAEALFRVFSEGRRDKGNDWRFDQGVESVWRAMVQTSTQGSWTRTEAFAVADDLFRRTKEGEVKIRGLRWITRGFGLSASHGLVTALVRMGYDYRNRHDLYMRSVGAVRYDGSTWQRDKLKSMYMKITPPANTKRKVVEEIDDDHGEGAVDEHGNPRRKRKKIRWERVSKAEAEIVEAPFSRVRNMLRRPTGCMHFHDQVLDADDRHELGKRHVVCEQRATCPSCAVRGMASAYRMIADRGSEWSWDNVCQKLDWPRFYLCYVTAESIEQIKQIRKYVTQDDCPFPKIVVSYVDLRTGRPGLLYVAQDLALPAYIRGPVARVAYDFQCMDTYVEPVVKSVGCPLNAASMIMEAALTNVCWTEQLMREDRDEDLLEWVSFLKSKPLIVSRRMPVRWPSRNAVRNDLVKPADSFEEYEGQKVVYSLTHTQTNYVVDTALVPHTIDQALDAASNNASFQQFHERFLNDLGAQRPEKKLETRPKIRPPKRPPPKPIVIGEPVYPPGYQASDFMPGGFAYDKRLDEVLNPTG